MLNPAELYRIVDDGDRASSMKGEFPVLVHHLQGYLDAGHAGRLAADHLLSTLPATVVATFDIDQLLDYRARRPEMTFDNNHWADYDDPKLTLYAMSDGSGTPFLLLTGPEPDTQWERFTAAVTSLVEHFGVRLTVGLNAIPMAIPHTRPTGVTAHGTRRELIADHPQWPATVKLPGSAAALLELRLGQAGHDAMGLAAHVPHYLSETEYPQAAHTLLEHVTGSTGLTVPTDALARAARDVALEIERTIAESEQARKVVRSLEHRYDSEVSALGRPSLLADDEPVPSGEEIGAEIERFLFEQGHETG